MKNLISTLLIYLFIINILNAQEITLEHELDIDPQTNKVKFERVVNVKDSIGTDILFQRSKEWIVSSFRDVKEVIQTEDKELGQIIGKGRTKINTGKGVFAPAIEAVFQMKIDHKENRVRLIITQIIYEVEAKTYVDGVRSQIVEVPCERWIIENINRKSNKKAKVATIEEMYTLLASFENHHLNFKKVEDSW